MAQRRHLDNVFAAAAKSPDGGDDFVSQSWLRSLAHKLDPNAKASPTILTNAELADARGPLDRLASIASDELDRLFATIRHAGYTVLLCNDKGVIVDHRGERDEEDRYRFWGSWLGAVWSEEVEGTNGIGTCIVEKRPVTIHRAQHFRGRHIGLSCASAPIFNHEDQLIAVLDAASLYPALSESSHALASSLVIAAALSIEERLFRETFRSCWICAVRTEGAGEPGMLFAVDGNLDIIATGLAGREYLQTLADPSSGRLPFWSVFHQDPTLFRANGDADRAVRLVSIAGSDARFALITPPEARLTAGWSSSERALLHTRPRLDLFSRFLPREPVFRMRGGLSSIALKRVRDHVEANLEQGVNLQSMAEAAGLSVHHFARAFKETEGITPHVYVMKSRVEKSKHLLTHSGLSLAEVALLCGFADQSHFARSFRRLTGKTPSLFRSVGN